MERRDILKGGGVVSVGILGISGLANSKHEDAAAELSQLAEHIDNSDLSTPPDTVNMTSTVERSLERAEGKLRSPGTKTERWTAGVQKDVSGLLAVLPGIHASSPEPKIEREIDAIKAAIQYYRDLKNVFEKSQSLFLSIRNRQTVSVQWGEGLPSPVTKQSVTKLEDQFAQFTEAEQGLPEVAGVQRLTPDREQVAQELEQLIEGYTHYVRAQTAYLETCEKIEQGATRWEQDEKQAAEAAFGEAIARTDIEIPEQAKAFSLYGEEASLSEFQEILQKYQSGAKNMQNACERSGEGQRDSFNTGIELVMNARGQMMELV